MCITNQHPYLLINYSKNKCLMLVAMCDRLTTAITVLGHTVQPAIVLTCNASYQYSAQEKYSTWKIKSTTR